MRKCRVRRRQEGFDWAVQWQKTDRPGSPYRPFDSIKPTYSIFLRALRRPITRTHWKTEGGRGRAREKGRAYRGNPSVTPTKLIPISFQLRPELSSLFVKINLWLPLTAASPWAKSESKCHEARFFRALPFRSNLIANSTPRQIEQLRNDDNSLILRIIHSRFDRWQREKVPTLLAQGDL